MGFICPESYQKWKDVVTFVFSGGGAPAISESLSRQDQTRHCLNESSNCTCLSLPSNRRTWAPSHAAHWHVTDPIPKNLYKAHLPPTKPTLFFFTPHKSIAYHYSNFYYYTLVTWLLFTIIMGFYRGGLQLPPSFRGPTLVICLNSLHPSVESQMVQYSRYFPGKT